MKGSRGKCRDGKGGEGKERERGRNGGKETVIDTMTSLHIPV